MCVTCAVCDDAMLCDASEKFPIEPRLILGIARVYDMLNDTDKAINYYKRVLNLDSSSIESIACLGAHYFYSDQVRGLRRSIILCIL